MIRATGALALAMVVLSACAEMDSQVDSLSGWLFPPQEAGDAGAQAGSEGGRRPLAGFPPLPRRKPGPGSQLALAEADPERLVGLDFDATKALLGDPAQRREQPPAKVWAYDGGHCLFSVFFYPSVDDTTFRVLAYEVSEGTAAASAPEGGAPAGGAEAGAARIRDKNSPLVRRCFADLLHSRRQPNAG